MKIPVLMITGPSLPRRGAWLAGAVLLFVHHAALACPGCQQPGTEGGRTALSGISLGFGFGVFFMIFMVVAVLGVLGRMMYRSCMLIAAQQQAAMASEDLRRGGRGLSTASPA